jgi:hypothetical protein
LGWDCHRRSNIQKGEGWNPITSLPPPHSCACPKLGPGFLTLYVMVFLVFNYLRLDVIVCFIDIGGIVDHNCLLNFLLSNYHPAIVKEK